MMWPHMSQWLLPARLCTQASIHIKVSTVTNTKSLKKGVFLYLSQKATHRNYCERMKFSFLSFNYSTCLLSSDTYCGASGVKMMRSYNIANVLR